MCTCIWVDVCVYACIYVCVTMTIHLYSDFSRIHKINTAGIHASHARPVITGNRDLMSVDRKVNTIDKVSLR